MNKDVIYIDVEDDITAIIGKVKAAKEKIVALVPPKRIGVLQSAVNLRLLARMAETNGKRLVLITNNRALIALSAASKIPIAKNLQTKPEIAEIAALEVDDGDDVIDGSQLPIGDLERTADTPVTSAVDEAAGSIEKEPAPAAAHARPAARPFPKSAGAKVPNFDKFRKKLFLIIGGVILLIGFFIWAIFFAPHATVAITAKTSNLSVDQSITLDPVGKTDFETSKLHTIVKTQKKTQSVDFDATGTKDIGNKASGTMTLANVYSTEGSITVPAGSKFSSGNYTFVTTSSVTVPRAQFVGGLIPGKADVDVVAENLGDEYNLSPRTYNSDSVDGISAEGGQMSGGTHQEVKVVTAGDVQTASEQLVKADDSSAKAQLKDMFSEDYVVLDQSYNIAHADAVSTPAVGAELASGKAKLTSDTTYTLIAVSKSDLGTYLDAAVADALKTKPDQRSYDNGASSVSFTQFTTAQNVSTVKLSATAQIGPKIDDGQVKDQARGKRYGEVQAKLEAVPGISSVDVKFSPFWVNTVPDNVKKITVQFNLQHDS